MKRAIRWFGIAIGILLLFFAVISVLGTLFVFQVPITLAFGWIAFLARVLPKMQPSLSGAVVAGVLAAVVVCLGQWLAGSFYNRPETAEAGGRRWPLRWTLLGLGGLVLVFGLTIASAGIIHQTGWLASSKQSWIESSWDTPRFRLGQLCSRINAVSDKPFADAAQTLWTTGRIARVAEEYRILLVEGPDGTLVDIVAIPHALDPGTGRLLACRNGDYPASALPVVLDAVRSGRLPSKDLQPPEGTRATP